VHQILALAFKLRKINCKSELCILGFV